LGSSDTLEPVTIDFIQTEEGRTINAGSSYNYEYTLTDHLGNNRVAFDQTTGKVGEVIITLLDLMYTST
jgi:hypothetical protein